MKTRGEVLLDQLRDGNFGAGGYAVASVDTLIQNVLSDTADPVVTKRLARRLKVIWPAFKAGLERRFEAANGQSATTKQEN